MQAAPYNPSSRFADDERNNSGGRSTVRADRLDAELSSVAVSVNGLRTNLAIIQRDDGHLIDSAVEPYNFSAASKAFVLATKWAAKGLWLTASAYVLNDMVDVAGNSYICASAHTSGVFATDYAAGKWQIFTNSSTGSSVSFTPTTTISSTNAQAAISEVDTKLRAAAMPALSAFYGGF